MSTTLTNMGLVSWTSGNDFFSSSDLSANWSKVDAHDHTTGKGVQIPTAGLANGAVTGAKLAADAVDGTKILDGSVSAAELGAGSVTSTKLQANPYLLGRMLMQAGGSYVGSTADNTVYPLTLGSGAIIATAQRAIAMRYLDLASPQITPVGGTWSTRYIIDWNVITNSVAPVATVTLGLYPVTAGGGASNVLTPTLGPVVTGSSGTQGSTSANLRANYVNAFAAPAAGYYAIGANLTGTLAAGATVSVYATLYSYLQ